MYIVKPYARILNIDKYGNDYSTRPFSRDDGMSMLRRIEWCGRISHRSEDVMEGDGVKESDDSRTLKFIRAVVIEHGDWSITEHCSLSVDFLVDRGITHEIVRHRHFSFTQESTRFVNYEKKIPPSFIKSLELDDRAVHQDGSSASEVFDMAMKEAEWAYKIMIDGGIKPQIARSVFPNALASRIVMTGNLRAWRHFFIMRTSKEAHPQMREVSILLLQEFKNTIPLLYDDIVPESRQIENLRLAE